MELVKQNEIGDQDGVQVMTESAAAALNRSEVETQIRAAKRWPRDVAKFVKNAKVMATMTTEIAESCMYALPRGKDKDTGEQQYVTGPSVRLAEICAATYGNIHFGARVMHADDTHVYAQGVAWDLEGNVRVSTEVQRSIIGRGGKRYSDDMVTVTGMAAASIALRNAVFRVVPRAYIDVIYAAAREMAVGTDKTLADRQAKCLAAMARVGVSPERVFARCKVAGASELTLAHIEDLIGVYQAIANGTSVEEFFPVQKPETIPGEDKPEGTKTKLEKGK